METATKIVLIAHIISGFIALLTGFISMLNKKGSNPHKRIGKIFFIAMTGVFVTSIFLSIVKNNPFLFMVGFFSYYLACTGYRILYRKKINSGIRPKPIDYFLGFTGIVVGLALIIFSIEWFTNRGAWGLVPVAFGSFCCFNGYIDLRSFAVPPTDKTHWITRHGSRMGGSFAATLTAFIVVNFTLGSLTWILWILPGVLTGIWISRALKNYLPAKKSTTVQRPI